MEQENRIRSREEIPQEDKWAIEDLYPSDAAWEEDLAALEADGNRLASYAGRLGESGEVLCSYLTEMETMSVRARRLANYAMRRSDEDTRVAHYQAMSGRFNSVYTAVGTATSFDTPEIMTITDEQLEGFYAACPGLERYRRYLTNARRMKPHTLSAAEEKLLAAADEVAQTPDNIFSAFTNADLSFPDVTDGEGKTHALTNATFVPLQCSPDRTLRANAYAAYYDTLTAFKNTAAATLNGQNKQLKFFADARRYNSAFEAALFRTNVPTDVYLNLIEAVHQNLDKMHRYVRLRKKLLGVEKLHFYDVYTNLVSDVDRKIPYEEAKQTIYDALEPLGEGYRAILKEGFDSRWVDVYPNPGKRGGAYSAGTPVHPFVLMNYTGTLKSQFTLAHEMGHAIHSYLSDRHQNPIDAHYVIFVAEVASTCNEALLME